MFLLGVDDFSAGFWLVLLGGVLIFCRGSVFLVYFEDWSIHSLTE